MGTRKLEFRIRCQGHYTLSTYLSFVTSFILQTDSVQMVYVVGKISIHQLLGFITSYQQHQRKENHLHRVCRSLLGWVLIGSPWMMENLPTSSPIPVSRGRELPFLVRTVSHDPSCVQESPESAAGRRKMEEKQARWP